MTEQHIARMRIDFDVLANAFLLPEGTKIHGVQMDEAMRWQGIFEVYLSHDDLPPVRLGDTVPLVDPLYETRHIPAFGSWDGRG